jgi:hypothetical protein
VVDLLSDADAAMPREVRQPVTAARAVPPSALEHVVDVEMHASAEGADPRG